MAIEQPQIPADQWTEAKAAMVRSAINIVITIADFAPGAGDALSWGADLLKLAKFTRGKLHDLDLTPDVSITVAWGTELVEPLTAGFFPTHIIETSIQLYHDIPRIIKGLKARRTNRTA